MSAIEKRKAHYHLAQVQGEVVRLRRRGLHQDRPGRRACDGLTTAEMLAVIASLTRRDFYKAMTSFADHRVWQDVYRAPTPVRKDAYI